MISRSSPFDFVSAYVSGAFSANQEIEARVYFHGLLMYYLTNNLNQTIATDTGSFIFADPGAPHFNQRFYIVLIL